MRPSFAFASVAMVFAALFVLAGCGDSGPPKSVVKGRLTEGGKPLQVKTTETGAGELLMLWLQHVEPGKSAEKYYAQRINEDGSFELKGGDNRGVPQGRYKVCIVWWEKGPGTKDLLKGKFDEKNSKIVRDIPPPGGELAIDLSNPEG
ncbi:MAG: hypothetical protein NZO58_00735 [Gemmataceae bacterium]|nr:hypothetical protein [Gemmataceae bacterium]